MSVKTPEMFDLLKDGSRFYVSNEEDAKVSVIDLAGNKVPGRDRSGRGA